MIYNSNDDLDYYLHLQVPVSERQPVTSIQFDTAGNAPVDTPTNITTESETPKSSTGFSLKIDE